MGKASEKRNPRPDDPVNLDQLVRQVRKGDEEAFGVLVQHYHQRLYHVVYRFVPNRDDAMELAQQVWVKAWNKRTSFRGESAFFTWLYRIAHFTCLDFIRSRARRPEDEFNPDLLPRMDPSVQSAPSRDGRPDHAAEHAEVRERFEAALSGLTQEHRTALVLREVEGLSYDEIARVMRCRKGTVMSRIFYARRKIQEEMKDCL